MIPRFPVHNFLFHPDVFHIVSEESDTFVLSGGEKNAMLLPHCFVVCLNLTKSRADEQVGIGIIWETLTFPVLVPVWIDLE